MQALIDGDIVAHRVAWTTIKDSVKIAKYRTDEMLDGILEDVVAKEFRIFLSDGRQNTFRYHLFPLYKANRTQEPPPHLAELKQYILEKWAGEISIGMEADDSLGIYQHKDAFTDRPQTIICSIDKDLKQIPGHHYNFVKKERDVVTPIHGMFEFYKQLLIGDSVDNIPGCEGIGKVKSDQILREASSPEEMCQSVIEAYAVAEATKHGNGGDKDTHKFWSSLMGMILMSGRLLKIKQTEDEALWEFPSCPLVETFRAGYTPLDQVDVFLSTEPTEPETSGALPAGQ